MSHKIKFLVAGSIFICISAFAQISNFIVVDQFGYTPNALKIAFIRDPHTGFDAAQSFTPGATYSLINEQNNTAVLTAAPSAWNGGTTDASSGDKVWWFDFTTITTEGRYHVKDNVNNAKSATFVIADTVYKSVLKAAMRMLYYQRAGIAKTATFAGSGYADAASHIGSLQDKNARLYNNNTVGTEKEISGGWYDAGDYNQYTPWTANYVVALLLAYQENPTVWTDNYNIPESGNGIPDIIDEIKWGMDWLLKMSQANGSSLCVLGRDGASPPSSATGQSFYGPATTNATLRSASAFALGARILPQVNASFTTYASTLQTKAIAAWDWAATNTNVTFDNNSASNGSVGLAAGNQETDAMGRSTAKLGASLYLFELTNNSTYKTFFDANYNSMPLIAWSNYASQYFLEQQEILMYYTSLANATPSVVTAIKNASNTAFNKTGDFFSTLNTDPYRTFIKDYNWGSNQYKSNYGNIHWLFAHYDFSTANSANYLSRSEEYLHYIHGANPLGFCYLTNMSAYGAEKSINEIYHTWFANGSAQWDRVGTSTHGPPPGFLSGGAYSSYNRDACCPSGCGSPQNNALCTAESTTPPLGQPNQKAYKDFNTGWPINSWSVTEPSLGYQTAYIRLLSKFTKNTATTEVQDKLIQDAITIFPNPANDIIEIKSEFLSNQSNITAKIYNAQGVLIKEDALKNNAIPIQELSTGVYQVIISNGVNQYAGRFVKY
jgi:hypothetical protein